jgi:RNA polymerase sigma factor (sigma-70 family)
MSVNAASWGLLWDRAVVEAVAPSQRWVLTAMRRDGEALVAMLWRILGNEQDVCDAYQDTFLKLARYQGGGRPDNVKAFVFRTASNVAITMLRKRARHERACRAFAERAAATAEANGLPDLDAGQLQQALRSCIARLPERLQVVVVLRDLAELSYAEVARLLEMSVASVRVYRFRAIRLLSAWMAGREDGEP